MLSGNEWDFGDGAQRKWHEILVGRGHITIPVYEMGGLTIAHSPTGLFISYSDRQMTGAPMLRLNDTEAIPAPDMLVYTSSVLMWHDVKAKSKPTWRRNGSRWEHGCDLACAEDYRKAQQFTGAPAYIVVQETSIPTDAGAESDLEDGNGWLFIRVDDAFVHGDIRTDWPGGKHSPRRRGKRGKGGLLWPRESMTRFQ